MVMADDSFVNIEIKCELLCYVQNKFFNATKNGLVTAISGFYTLEEIVEAKAKLFDTLEKLRVSGHVIDGKHRLVQRKMSDNKRKMDTEDILNLFSDLDSAGVRLPVFTAAKLKRIPPFEPDATDICSLTFAVDVLQTQMGAMQDKLCVIIDQLKQPLVDQVGKEAVPKVTSVAVPVVKPVAARPAVAATSDSLSCTSGSSVAGHTDNHQWASLLDGETECTNAWKLVSPKKTGRTASSAVMNRPKASVKLTGSRNLANSDNSVKAIPRKAVLSAYVGRLHLDTTDEDLTRFLTDVGLRGVVCKKLKAKDGKVFHTSAFYVTCSADYKDLFMMMPAGR